MYTTLVDWARPPDRHRRLRQAVRRYPHRDRRGAPRRHAEERHQGGPAVVHRQGCRCSARRSTSFAAPARSCSCSPTRSTTTPKVVMSYLLDGERKAYPSWRNYFDIVIVGGAKPAFFNELRPFVQIDPADRRRDTDERPGRWGDQASVSRDKVYQGGNVVAFEQMTGIKRRAGPLHRRPHLRRHPPAPQATHVAHRDGAAGARARDLGRATGSKAQIQDLELLDRRHRNLESRDRLPDAAAQEDRSACSTM